MLVESGVDGISMRKVADRVGVSATALYRHYRNKEALLEAVTEESFAVFTGTLRPALERKPALAALAALADRVLQFALDHPVRYDFLFIIRRKNVRRFPDDFTMRRSESFRMLHHLVEVCIAERTLIDDDPLEVALTIWAHTHGLIALHYAGRFGGDPRRFRGIYARSCERVLKGLKR